jgi:hypothetical protein
MRNGCDDHHLSRSCSRGTVKPLSHSPGTEEPLAPANRSVRYVGAFSRCERLVSASKQLAGASNSSKSLLLLFEACSRHHCKASKRLDSAS